jgi:uncharacterized protein YndB with AHSA1/START domain
MAERHHTKRHEMEGSANDMADIRHRVGINAPQQQVYAALATKEGLADWWTRDVQGDPTPGGMLRFSFFGSADLGAVMKVAELIPERRVEWHCAQGPEEWVDTTLTFDLKPEEGGEIVLLLTHAGWREPVEFMHHCSTKWAYHLLGLKERLESGALTAYPISGKISSWG